MNTLEQVLPLDSAPDFGMELDLGLGDFDINAAFQEAMYGVATDAELALEEKVRRMEVIVSEGTSELYRDFVDFTEMAAQMEWICNEDHELHHSMQGSDMLADFMDRNKTDEVHDRGGKHTRHDDEYEVDPKTGKKTKKKKRRRGWFGIYL